MDSPSDIDEDLKTDQDQQQQEDSSTSETSDIVNTEDSSNSNKSEEDPSTFDVVMDAIKPDEEKEEEETDDNSEGNSEEDDDSGKEPKGDKKEESEDEFEDFSPEEKANLNKKTAQRFDKLKGLYHKSKEEKEVLETKLEEATVDAGNYKQFVGFLEENRITGEEANQLFDIGALMKNDPVKALEAITPYYQNLLQMTGNILPDDLQQQVAQGYLTQEHATEISRSRAMGKVQPQINQEQQQHKQQQQQARQQTEQANNIQGAIANWEKTWSTSDPDYSTKKDRVLERVELMLARANREGTLPKTVEEAVKLAEQAKRHVEADFRKFMPKKSISTVDGGSSVTSQVAPKDTKDVIRRALNN